MTLSIAIAQANPTVGDVSGNLAIIRRMRDDAAAQGADPVVFPELMLVGYPPEDLVLRPDVVDATAAALRELQRDSASTVAVAVTLPWKEAGCLHNAVTLGAHGQSEPRV